MRSMEIEVIVHKDASTDDLWAEVVQLPGCFASGRSRDDLMQSLEEAVELYLRDGDISATTSDRLEGVEHYRVSNDFKLFPAN